MKTDVNEKSDIRELKASEPDQASGGAGIFLVVIAAMCVATASIVSQATKTAQKHALSRDRRLPGRGCSNSRTSCGLRSLGELPSSLSRRCPLCLISLAAP